MLTRIFILSMLLVHVFGQRPFFAGSRPIGYPEMEISQDDLNNRFGEVDGTTPKLPLEANGDRQLINRLSKLPVDQQPFWFINWQALEQDRQNPQTYPQNPNSFIDFSSNQGNRGNQVSTANNNQGFFNPSQELPSGNQGLNNVNEVNRNQGVFNRNPDQFNIDQGLSLQVPVSNNQAFSNQGILFTNTQNKRPTIASDNFDTADDSRIETLNRFGSDNDSSNEIAGSNFVDPLANSYNIEQDTNIQNRNRQTDQISSNLVAQRSGQNANGQRTQDRFTISHRPQRTRDVVVSSIFSRNSPTSQNFS